MPKPDPLTEYPIVVLGKYKLKKNMPGLPVGVIFEHRKYDKNHPDRGNVGCGCMILAWVDGNCQPNKHTHPFLEGTNYHSWCGETFVLPGQLAKDEEWFESIEPVEVIQVGNHSYKLVR